MSLHYPWMLFALLLIPGLLYLRYNRRRRVPIRYSDISLVKTLPRSWAVRAEKVLPLLYAIGWTVLIVALARPQKGLDESVTQTEIVDIVLLVDVSTSMRALDFSTVTQRANRLDKVKEVMESFINKREEDRISIVAFAGLAYTLAPLTLDHGWLIQQLDRLKTGMIEDGTAVGSAIASAVNRLRDSKAISKVIILLTDGDSNAGNISPENAAQAAKALGIKVYTVGAGKEGMVPMPVRDPFGGERIRQVQSSIDEKTLMHIADVTGASFFRARDAKSLSKVYEEIDELEKTKVEIEKFTRYEERFQPFLIAALLCFILEKLLTLGRLGRLL